MVRELGTGFDEMLAVIQDEEQLFAAQIIRDGINEWDTLHFTQAETWMQSLRRYMSGQPVAQARSAKRHL